jgi:hypothetical protein
MAATTKASSPVAKRTAGAELQTDSAARRSDVRGEMTEPERDRLLRSVITSQALEGVHLSYDEAAELLDEVLREPPATIR